MNRGGVKRGCSDVVHRGYKHFPIPHRTPSQQEIVYERNIKLL